LLIELGKARFKASLEPFSTLVRVAMENRDEHLF
jgi:hypothetical protein